MAEYIRSIKLILEVDTNKRMLTSKREFEYLSKGLFKDGLKEMVEEVRL